MIGSEYPVRPEGLTEEEVQASRRKYGSNRLSVGKGKGFFKRLAESFQDPIIRILLIALGINLLLLRGQGDPVEAVGIGAAIFLSTFISTLSECGSERAFRALRAESENVRCRVRRAGAVQSIAADELTVGDLVLLTSGEKVPADGRILTGEVAVNLSALNGESASVRRRAGYPAAEWSPDATSLLFRGATVAEGECTMQVLRVGDETLYGKMAQEMQEEVPDSPLKEKLSHLAKILSRIGYGAAALVAAADLLHTVLFEGIPTVPALIAALLHALTLGITVVVVAVPEGLPMMIAVVLSANTVRMLQDHVMVRKLVGIETAGGLNLLFTDKTGTLTRGDPEVSAVVLGDGSRAVSPATLPPALGRILTEACRKSSQGELSADGKGAVGGNETDRMLLKWVGLRYRDGEKRVSFVPFDSARKYASGTVAPDGRYHTYFKGAPELLLPSCTRMRAYDGTVQPFSGRQRVLDAWKEATAAGARVLAVAERDGTHRAGESPGELCFVGLFLLKDSIRVEARSAVERLQAAGIGVVMVTGDNRETAVAVARSVGILHKQADGSPDPSEVILTGTELEKLQDSELSQLLPRLRVVARVLPRDKSRLVRIAREAGMVVGMTGDGVNDAAALRRADVGFSMGGGTEIAKDASDIVILDNNIASIAKAVLYGRTIFESIRKFLIFQLTMNFCAVGVSILAPFIGIDTPVTVLQMLWINLIMDTLAGLAFAGEAPTEETMQRPPYHRNTPVLSRKMLRRILASAGYCILLCLCFLKVPQVKAMFRPNQGDAVFMSAFFALFIFSGIFLAFHARAEHRNFLVRWRQNPAFLGIMTCIFAVQLLLIYFGGSLFRTVPLTAKELRTVLLFALTVLPAGCLYKDGRERIFSPKPAGKRKPKPPQEP